MKFTNTERKRIKAWLEKDPDSTDTGLTLRAHTSDGAAVVLGRKTTYFGEPLTWKIRTAFTQAGGFPVMSSSAIPAGQDAKKSAKSSNKAAFQKAMTAEMKSLEEAQAEWIKNVINPKPIFHIYGKK